MMINFYDIAFTTIQSAAERFQVTEKTIRNLLEEMEQFRGRYGAFSIGSGKLKRVNLLALADYWQYREQLQEPNLKKHIPEYNPAAIARDLRLSGGA